MKTPGKKLPKLFIKFLNSKKYEVSVKRKRRTKNSSEIEIETGTELKKIDSKPSKKLNSQGSVTSAAHEVLNDFCMSTSIHGVKYLNQSSWKSRLVWIAIYLFALWCCGFLVIERYVRWKQNPVIVSFDRRFEAISEVPFPAVTIW